MRSKPFNNNNENFIEIYILLIYTIVNLTLIKVAPYSYGTVQTGIYTDQMRVEFSRLGNFAFFGKPWQTKRYIFYDNCMVSNLK